MVKVQYFSRKISDMKLYNELKLRFDVPIWGLYSELALFDVILEKNPNLVQMVSRDVLKGIIDSNFGRKDSPTVEQVLRAAVYKEIKQLDYRTLEKDMYDSKICSMFLKLENGQTFSYSVMQKYISKISESSLRCIIQEINRIAIDQKIETVEKISTDTTTVETDVHYPTNNSLIYDCIKTATRLLKEIKRNDKDEQDKLDKKQQESKKYNYEINNTKKEEMPSLFAPYLLILRGLILESWRTIRNKDLSHKRIKELKDFIPMMIKVYKVAEKHQIQAKKVTNEEKLFSIFEPHTDILVKGQREKEFGHKVLITRGDSNLILDHAVLEGNPNDKTLLIPSIATIISQYGKVPESTSNDGGFISQENINACQKQGIINIVFTKVTNSLKNIVKSEEIEKTLKKWRGTTEAVISNIKRGFGLQRVTWEGFEKFCAKVAWSILGYNLRVISNRLFE
jgi:IS5 family transposase